MRLLIPPPIQALLCAGLMFLIAKFVPEFSFGFPHQQTVAVLLILVGLGVDFASIRLFMRNSTTVSPLSPQNSSRLVTDGIYRFSRNPMYLGLVIILSAFGVWLGNFAAFLLVPCFIGYVTKFQIIPEEEILLEKFKLEYADYCAQVGRWV